MQDVRKRYQHEERMNTENTETPWLTLDPDAPIDLQLHTTCSDGRWDLADLLDHIATAGFALVAVTDHDAPWTAAEVRLQGAARGVATVPAVEMSSTWEGHFLDLLCFGFDPADSGALGAIAADTRRRQLDNLRETYATLLRQGYQFPHADEVLAPHGGDIGDMHDIIALLDRHGHMADINDVLDGAGFQLMTADPAEIAAAAHSVGAVCLIAHPGRGGSSYDFDVSRLDRLRAAVPVDGLEVYYPSHTSERTEQFRAYAQAHGLLVSAGSDSHGPQGQLPIQYPAHLVRDLLSRLGVAVK
jgi:predicted metal-dependent phosphoesterase TrpH